MSEKHESRPLDLILIQRRWDSAASEETGWMRVDARATRSTSGSCARLADLVHAERLQLEVFGVSERDLVPANELVVVAGDGRRGDRRLSAR